MRACGEELPRTADGDFRNDEIFAPKVSSFKIKICYNMN